MTLSLHALNTLSAAWFHIISRATIQGAAALSLSFFITLACRSARIKCWWWRIAHLKLLLALFLLTPLTFPLLPAKILPIETSLTQSPPSPTARGNELSSTSSLLIISTASPQSPPSPTAPAIMRESPPSLSPAPEPPSWQSLLLTLWLLGLLFSALRLALSWNRARTLRRESSLLNNAPLTRFTALTARQLRLRKAPPLLISPHAPTPLLVSTIHPAIVLPPSLLETSSPRALELIITHELAHIARRDLWWNWLCSLVALPFFFHPLVWLARREWLASQEIACDELTLHTTRATPADYARTLLDVLTRSRTKRPGLFAVGIVTFTTTKRRMQAMRCFSPNPTRRLALPAIAAALVAAVGLIPWRVVAQPTPDAPVSVVPAPTTDVARSPAQSTQFAQAEQDLYRSVLAKREAEVAAMIADHEKTIADFQAKLSQLQITLQDTAHAAPEHEKIEAALRDTQIALEKARTQLEKISPASGAPILDTPLAPAQTDPAEIDAYNRLLTLRAIRLTPKTASENAARGLGNTKFVARLNAPTVNLASTVDGTVRTVDAKEGQQVKEGDILFTLNNEEQTIAVQLAQIEVKSAEALLERNTAAAKSASVAKAEVENAETALDRAKIALDRTKIDLEKLTIRSPINGIVNHSDLVPGQFAPKGSPVITVVDTSQLFLSLDLPQAESRSLRPGQKLTLAVQSIPDSRFDAEVIFVAPTIDAATNRCRIKASIKAPLDQLKPGMLASVLIPPI